jgi:hypothetical protein
MAKLRDILLGRKSEIAAKRDPLIAEIARMRERLTEKQSELFELNLEMDQVDSALKAVEETETKNQPTIKQAVLDVLNDRSEGMTALEILSEINTRFFYSHPYERTSLSPQLSRLKDDDKKIELKGNKWFLLPPEPSLFENRAASWRRI